MINESSLGPWQVYSGRELISILDSDLNLDGNVPGGPGVYMWKLNPGAGNLNYSQPSEIIKRLVKITTANQGRVKGSNHHSLQNEVAISGNGLQCKEIALSKMVQDKATAKWLIFMLESLSVHLPSLYVGQASNLATRLVHHLKGRTGFSNRLAAEGSYTFEDLNVYILQMDDSRKEDREALEHILSTLTIAAFSRRVG
jgi:hypothetical protein